MSTYIPKITIVEECKRADIGVGADIALINQLEKGNCALLAKGNIIKRRANNVLLYV
jgi:uncharacterized protein YaiI (UPF0178 family)